MGKEASVVSAVENTNQDVRTAGKERFHFKMKGGAAGDQG